ncbi:MAG: hypothetical protein ABSB88_13470 [Bryobacteraceae bacterium]|jgi:uncharacterized protein (TIGR03437 family)
MRAAGFFLAWAFVANAQIPPAVYLDLYSQLQHELTVFDAALASKWNGSKPPVDFCAELRAPGAYSVLASLGENTPAVVQAEIQSLQALGVTTVSVDISFPVLYQPFFTYNGDPGDYQKYLTFYEQVAADIRAAGLRLVVQTGPLYTGVLTQNSGFNVAAYYQTLTSSQYITARTHQIITIAQQIQPDYLVVAGEPDNEASMTGQPTLATSAGFTAMVDTFLTQLDDAGLTGTYVGAGIGTWLAGGSAFIKALVANPRLNFIDLHVYPINAGLLDTTVTLIDQAAAAGKPVAITSAWLEKRRDSEYPAPNIAADPNIFGRDPFSFWAPLDQQFLTELAKIAWWKQLALVSAYWSDYFHAYLPYNAAYAALSYNPLRDDEIQAFSTAIQNNQYTSTGVAWQNLIATPVGMPALVSAANAQAGPVAPDSIVSLFGSNLATSTASAPAMAPPTVLAGTSLTFSEGSGSVLPASLYFVSPGQVNAVVPAQLAAGPVTFQIGNSSGTATLAAVAPSLFSANSNGRGPAAAFVFRLHADGATSLESTVTCTAGACSNAPIDLSSATDQVYLELFGTGIRARGSLSDVRVSVGGVLVTPTYAGPQPQYPGMDQVNIPLPNALAGRGELNLDLSVAGHPANVVTINAQ